MRVSGFAIGFMSVLLGLRSGEAQRSEAPASPLVSADGVADSPPQELRLEAEMLSGGAGCSAPVWTGKHTTVGEIVGGKVVKIRVVRFASSVTTKKADQIPTVLRQVWEGQAEEPACYIAWDEAPLWSIEAVLEFDDGKRSLLVTDGLHVAVQDHEGHSNFMRMMPKGH